ncbi:hypothetical protein S40285_10698 [Stachybotrys chlorohalonatus IBT 40285]|uniref:2EXR domain-containing protein n=1 Tax=Stachybotrys chlorohalonatus (strain IBT 40285) TaxID=1283841 RepID=A0A084QYH9_STAC4|nr:hypothetical protein S40285_10698 [Stachybotrys chlorohalonata IBT 40285]
MEVDAFDFFPRLPLGIQRRIWKFAVRQKRLLHINPTETPYLRLNLKYNFFIITNDGEPGKLVGFLHDAKT